MLNKISIIVLLIYLKSNIDSGQNKFGKFGQEITTLNTMALTEIIFKETGSITRSTVQLSRVILPKQLWETLSAVFVMPTIILQNWASNNPGIILILKYVLQVTTSSFCAAKNTLRN